MTVIANDFVPVVPYQTDVVSLGVGQRTDIIVKATGKDTDSFWIRSNITTIGALAPIPPQPYALAAIYYSKANTSAFPQSTTTPLTQTSCGQVHLHLTTAPTP